MAKQCSYCGNPLPVSYRLRGKQLHPECKQEQAAIRARYENRLYRSANSLSLSEETQADLSRLGSEGKFTPETRRTMDQSLYDRLGESFFEDSHLSVEERQYLSEVQHFFGLSDAEADAQKLDHIRHLTDISEGNLPNLSTSVRLQKGETGHYEGPVTWKHLKTRRKRVAGSRSSSIRVAKGIRIPIGGTPGHTEEYEEFVTVDEGKTVITSKRLLFFGSKKNFAVKYDKIMELEYYSDGVKINRGTVNPTYFVMDDPSLFYVVLSTLWEGHEI